MISDHQVTRHRPIPGGIDRYGNPQPEFQAEELTERCLLAPGAGDEPSQSAEEDSTIRNQLVITARAYFPNSYPDITADDELEIAGDRYQVIGRPSKWGKPGDVVGGTSIALKEVLG